MQQVLIDKFYVPAAARAEFDARALANRRFIRTLPGFVADVICEQPIGENAFTIVTTAVWDSETAVQNAREAVGARYAAEGFDPAEMFKRLNITLDRAIYRRIQEVV